MYNEKDAEYLEQEEKKKIEITADKKENVTHGTLRFHPAIQAYADDSSLQLI